MDGKHILIMVVFALAIQSVSAADGCFVGENCTWWAYDGTGQTTAVNISITYPNGSDYTTNQEMVADGGGRYYYTTVFNTTGNYIGVYEFYNSTGSNFYDGAESKEITEEFNVLTFTILFGLIALAAALIFFSKDIMTKPKGQTNNAIMKIIDGKNMGVFIYLIASWIVVAMVGFMYNISLGETYEGILLNIFILVSLLVTAFNIGYLSLYILHTIQERMTQAGKVTTRRGR